VRVSFWCIVGLFCFLEPTPARSDPPARFELHDGDRIVLIGDTLIERDQRYGYLETLLSISNPDKNLVFRNLGWSGDTVGGASRSGFDPPEAGFEQLRQQILAVKPTVIVLGYGMADSFAGEAGLPAFEQGISRLLNVIDSTKARVVLLSPVAHADLGRPLPNPASHNRDLARYRDVIKRFAKERSAPFVDIFENLYSVQSGHPLTKQATLTADGIHLTADGYREAAFFISDQLGQDRGESSRRLVLKHDGTIVNQVRTKASHVEKTAVGLRFQLIDDVLPHPVPCRVSAPKETPLDPRRLAIQDLAPGKYDLKVDGISVVVADSEEWQKGVTVTRGPEFDQVLALRAAINRKNDLFFYRWRPQNITYLLGFRKHEQGNNAVEIPQFDPLVAEQEKIIARLKKSVTHIYELSRVEKEVAR
jgi:lysophospholipase L1-like esterase